MSTVMALKCANGESLVMGCDSILTCHDEYVSEGDGFNKVRKIGSFLGGFSGNCDKINDVLRYFETNTPSNNIKELYEKIVHLSEETTDEDMLFILCGNERGKLSIYYHYNSVNPPTDYYYLGAGKLIVDYLFLDSKRYNPGISLNEGLLLVLESLKTVERFTFIGPPFNLYYYENPDSEPKRVDENLMQKLEFILAQKKERINNAVNQANQEVNQLSITGENF